MSNRTTRLATLCAASAVSLAPLLSLAAPNATASPNTTASPKACSFRVVKTVKAGLPADTGPVAFDLSTGEIYVAGDNASMLGGVVALNGQTYKPSAFIKTGLSPDAIAVNPGSNTIYVANRRSDSLSVINGSDGKVTATIRPVAALPIAVDVDRRNGRIYVTGLNGDISIINSATDKVVGTIQIVDNLDHAALNQATGLLYASNDSFPGNPGTIYVVNVNTRRIVARIRPGGYSRPTGIAVNSRTNTIYVVDSPGLNTGVFVINGSTNRITTRIRTGFITGEIALDPDNDFVYVLSGGVENNSITQIDGRNNQVGGTVPLDTMDAGLLGVNAPGGLVYVTAQDGELVVLNGCR